MAEAALVLSIKLMNSPLPPPLRFQLSSHYCSRQRLRVQQNQHILYPSALSYLYTYYRSERSLNELYFFFKRGRGINLNVLQYSPEGGARKDMNYVNSSGNLVACPSQTCQHSKHSPRVNKTKIISLLSVWMWPEPSESWLNFSYR